MEKITNARKAEFNKSIYPNINAQDIANGHQKVENIVRLEENLAKLQGMIKLVEDFDSSLETKSKNKLLELMKKDMQELMKEIQKSKENIEEFKNELAARVSIEEKTEEVTNRASKNSKVVDDAQMENLATGRRQGRIESTFKKVSNFLKGKEKRKQGKRGK